MNYLKSKHGSAKISETFKAINGWLNSKAKANENKVLRQRQMEVQQRCVTQYQNYYQSLGSAVSDAVGNCYQWLGIVKPSRFEHVAVNVNARPPVIFARGLYWFQFEISLAKATTTSATNVQNCLLNEIDKTLPNYIAGANVCGIHSIVDTKLGVTRIAITFNGLM